MSRDQRVTELNDFRNEYGREPRIRYGWEVEHGLAHWYSRQRKAAAERKLSPNRSALPEENEGIPTAELARAVPTVVGGYVRWFGEFCAEQTNRSLSHSEGEHSRRNSRSFSYGLGV